MFAGSFSVNAKARQSLDGKRAAVHIRRIDQIKGRRLCPRPVSIYSAGFGGHDVA